MSLVQTSFENHSPLSFFLFLEVCGFDAVEVDLICFPRK